MCALYPAANPLIVAKNYLTYQSCSINTTMHTPSCVNTHTWDIEKNCNFGQELNPIHRDESPPPKPLHQSHSDALKQEIRVMLILPRSYRYDVDSYL